MRAHTHTHTHTHTHATKKLAMLAVKSTFFITISCCELRSEHRHFHSLYDSTLVAAWFRIPSLVATFKSQDHVMSVSHGMAMLWHLAGTGSGLMSHRVWHPWPLHSSHLALADIYCSIILFTGTYNHPFSLPAPLCRTGVVSWYFFFGGGGCLTNDFSFLKHFKIFIRGHLGVVVS